MKLSEKIQEALRQQQEINLSDPVVQKRLAAQWGYVPADAQPAPSFADAYQGAMEEAAIWKKRALEAEDLNRKFIAEINGPTHMGEPAQPTPSVPDGWKLVPTAESRHPGIHKMLNALHAVDNTPGASEWESYAAFLAATPEAKP